MARRTPASKAECLMSRTIDSSCRGPRASNKKTCFSFPSTRTGALVLENQGTLPRTVRQHRHPSLTGIRCLTLGRGTVKQVWGKLKTVIPGLPSCSSQSTRFNNLRALFEGILAFTGFAIRKAKGYKIRGRRGNFTGPVPVRLPLSGPQEGTSTILASA